MEPREIYKHWDEVRKRERSIFRLKAPVIIKENDSDYTKSVKKLINKRISLNLSTEDVADALGLSRTTVSGIESFRGKENWIYVYALDYLLCLYEQHLDDLRMNFIAESEYKI